MQTGQYSAALGTYSGAQVDMVVKAGTNKLHGSAYDFLRNNEFNARQMRELRKSWEDEQAGPVPDRLAQLLAQLERADSPSGAPSQVESRPSASADSSSSALARKS